MTCIGQCHRNHQTSGVHAFARVGGPPEDLAWRESGAACHPPSIRPTAWINAFATVDAGTSRPTCVGHRSVILAHAHVGHDAIIGSDVLIATGAIIGGHARVEDGAKIGLGAVVLPFRTVGRGAEVGAGSVVARAVPDGEVWAGNPARRMEKNPVPFTERSEI